MSSPIDRRGFLGGVMGSIPTMAWWRRKPKTDPLTISMRLDKSDFVKKATEFARSSPLYSSYRIFPGLPENAVLHVDDCGGVQAVTLVDPGVQNDPTETFVVFAG